MVKEIGGKEGMSASPPVQLGDGGPVSELAAGGCGGLPEGLTGGAGKKMRGRKRKCRG